MRFLPQVLAIASLFSAGFAQTSVPHIECFNQLPSGKYESLGSGNGEWSVSLWDSTGAPVTSFNTNNPGKVTVKISSNSQRNIEYFAISALPDIYPEFENYGNRRSGVFDDSATAPKTCENADTTTGNALISTSILDKAEVDVYWNVPSTATFSLLFYTTIITNSTEIYTLETYLKLDCTSLPVPVNEHDEVSQDANGCDAYSTDSGVQYWGINIGKGKGASTPVDPLSHRYSLKNHYGDNETSYEQPSIPGSAFLDYFLKSNSIAPGAFNTIRFPISWNEIQPVLGGSLDPTWTNNLVTLASTLEKNYDNATLVLDLHSFGHYTVNGVSYPITMGSTGSAPVTSDDFRYVWQLIGAAFINSSNVLFGLQNQPHNLLGNVTTQASEAWSNIAKAGIAGLRASGNKNLILLSGNGWSRLKDWWGTYTKDMEYGTANSEVMFNAVDEVANNLAYDINLFFDEDGNGDSDICYSIDNKPLFANFIIWLQNNGKRAFVTAIGSSTGDGCQVALLIALRSIVTNPGNSTKAGFIGWAYYMAGEESLGNSFSIQPADNDYNSTSAVATQYNWIAPFLYSNPVAQSSWSSIYTIIGKYAETKYPTSSSALLVSADRSVLLATLFAAFAIVKFFE